MIILDIIITMLYAKKTIITILAITVDLMLFSCGQFKNLQIEAQKVEKRTKNKYVNLVVQDEKKFLLSKYYNYLENTIKTHLISDKETKVIISQDNYDILGNVKIGNFSMIFLPPTNSIFPARVDIEIYIDTFEKNTNILSNELLKESYLINIPNEIFIRNFERESFIDDKIFKILNDISVNISSMILKGWPENYGLYSTKDGIIERILGGTSETNKTKAKRNIPVIGGE